MVVILLLIFILLLLLLVLLVILLLPVIRVILLILIIFIHLVHLILFFLLIIFVLIDPPSYVFLFFLLLHHLQLCCLLHLPLHFNSPTLLLHPLLLLITWHHDIFLQVVHNQIEVILLSRVSISTVISRPKLHLINQLLVVVIQIGDLLLILLCLTLFSVFVHFGFCYDLLVDLFL